MYIGFSRVRQAFDTQIILVSVTGWQLKKLMYIDFFHGSKIIARDIINAWFYFDIFSQTERCAKGRPRKGLTLSQRNGARKRHLTGNSARPPFDNPSAFPFALHSICELRTWLRGDCNSNPTLSKHRLVRKNFGRVALANLVQVYYRADWDFTSIDLWFRVGGSQL